MRMTHGKRSFLICRSIFISSFKTGVIKSNFVAAVLLPFPTGKVSPAKATWAVSKTWKYLDRPLIYSEIPTE